MDEYKENIHMQYMVLNSEHLQDVEHYHLIGISNKIKLTV